MEDGLGRVNYMLFYLLSHVYKYWLLQPLLSGLQVPLFSKSPHYDCYFESWQSGKAFNLSMGESRSLCFIRRSPDKHRFGDYSFRLIA